MVSINSVQLCRHLAGEQEFKNLMPGLFLFLQGLLLSKQLQATGSPCICQMALTCFSPSFLTKFKRNLDSKLADMITNLNWVKD